MVKKPKHITPAAAARELARRRQIDVDRLGQWLHDFMWAAMPRIVELEKRMQALEDAGMRAAADITGEPIERSN